MNITNGLCMMCHEKSNTRYIDQLKRIDRLLHGVEPTEKSLRIGCGRAFLWDIHIRCQYGMDCPELERRLSEAKKEARGLEERLIAVATGDDIRLYRETLRHLQGYFPAAYRLLERVHATAQKHSTEE